MGFILTGIAAIFWIIFFISFQKDILPEDRSATTYENLSNSKALVDSRPGRKYTALVTSNYHVYRALRYCKKLDFECTGIGSHVALYK